MAKADVSEPSMPAVIGRVVVLLAGLMSTSCCLKAVLSCCLILLSVSAPCCLILCCPLSELSNSMLSFLLSNFMLSVLLSVLLSDSLLSISILFILRCKEGSEACRLPEMATSPPSPLQPAWPVGPSPIHRNPSVLVVVSVPWHSTQRITHGAWRSTAD